MENTFDETMLRWLLEPSLEKIGERKDPIPKEAEKIGESGGDKMKGMNQEPFKATTNELSVLLSRLHKGLTGWKCIINHC